MSLLMEKAMLRNLFYLLILCSFSLSFISCGESGSSSNDLAESVIRFTNVTSDRLEMYPGQTFNLQVRRTYRDNDYIREQWVTSECQYLTDDTLVVTTDNTGKITAVQPGTTKVRAKFSQWMSSPDYCHVYIDVKEPPSPTNVVATESLVGKVVVYWGQITGATGYVVERSQNMNGVVDYTSPVVQQFTFEDTQVTAGKSYYYRVRAVFNNYSGKASVFVLGKALGSDASTIPAPTDVAASDALSGKIKVFWSPVVNASGYVGERSLTNGGTIDFTSANINGTSFEDTNVTVGTTYFYRVKAIVNSTQGTPSAYVPGKAI